MRYFIVTYNCRVLRLRLFRRAIEKFQRLGTLTSAVEADSLKRSEWLEYIKKSLKNDFDEKKFKFEVSLLSELEVSKSDHDRFIANLTP